MSKVVTRKNICNLTPEEKDNLIRAFAAIQQLPPDDPNSFFVIAGYHGQPFRGAGYANPSWWGGYCNHGNVLFPTWHRAYVLRLERALQSQVPGVAMPYWDETEESSLTKGIPSIFLERTYTFSDDTSHTIPNPLFSYKFQAKITDNLNVNDKSTSYTKPIGYETVRYPFSGLVGDRDKEYTLIHNKKLLEKGEVETNRMLNENIKTWLNFSHFKNNDGKMIAAGVKDKFKDCLNAPNYTVFSNTTSAQRWNDDRCSKPGYQSITSVESPHNSIHLAVGGFNVPGHDSYDQYAGANGDMGENDTASFDPIFFFHHCFIDLMFWRWQVKHNQRDSLEIIEGYPGTNSVDSQGPTPGVAGGIWLTLDSPLEPFKDLNDPTRTITSREVVNIANLGYTYDHAEPPLTNMPNALPAPILIVSNINRATLGGSFVVSAWANLENGDKVLVGTEAVLSRWHVAGCRNCQNHLEVRAHFPMEGWRKEEVEKMSFKVVLNTRTLDRGVSNANGPQQGAQNPMIELSTDNL
ncbi:hypothetical protein BGX21_003389 [Mortierella sp. AD011]|nr:hypothetical protein BGX20_003393 [Mortierella sp. AD010]KAF9376774.1 hypothetical protein BGX21_003389 [Mortierella sp. AD011]